MAVALEGSHAPAVERPLAELPEEAAPIASRRVSRLVTRWGPFAVYLTALTVWVALKGPPLTLQALMLWVFAATLAFSLHDLRRWVLGIALDWLPFFAFLIGYSLIRMDANILRSTNFSAAIDGDRLLFAGHMPTVWLQRHLWHGAAHVRWYDYACWGVYMTYFFATFVVAVALWVVAHDRFRRFIAAFAALSVTGLATYVLFPAAPPWFAAQHGSLPAAPRLTGIVWLHTSGSFSDVIKHGQGFADQVAAMPSLHAAFTLLITLVLWRSARWWWRIPLALYPLAMAFTLVYFAEHYVSDILAGWAYALVCFLAVERFAKRRAAKRERAPALSVAPAANAGSG